MQVTDYESIKQRLQASTPVAYLQLVSRLADQPEFVFLNPPRNIDRVNMGLPAGVSCTSIIDLANISRKNTLTSFQIWNEAMLMRSYIIGYTVIECSNTNQLRATLMIDNYDLEGNTKRRVLTPKKNLWQTQSDMVIWETPYFFNQTTRVAISGLLQLVEYNIAFYPILDADYDNVLLEQTRNYSEPGLNGEIKL